ncbi:MAG: universal stress protein [Pseudomonadales bacterium]|nr:universal stress protein [Pseudomonadales bacterium]
MSTYQHILLAIDLTEESYDGLLEKALELSKSDQCRLSILHVVRPVGYTYDRGLTMGLLDDSMKKLQEEAISQAKSKLAEIAKTNSIPEDRMHCTLGKTTKEIIKLSKELNVDLVVAGSHGNPSPLQHVGTTIRGIIDKLDCDTLIIRR